MKSKRILSSLMVFILSFSVLLSPLNVEAGGGGSSHPEGETVSDWSWWQKFNAKFSNWLRLCVEDIGVIANPTKYGDGYFRENYEKFLANDYLINNSDSLSSYEEFMMQHVYFSGDSDGQGGYLFNDNLKVSLDSEISDSIYAFTQAFVDENAIKYRIFDTTDYKQINPSAYNNKQSYDNAQSFLNEHNDDIVIGFSPNSTNIQVVDGSKILAFYFNDVKLGYSMYKGLFAMDEDYTSINRYDRYTYRSSDNSYGLFYFNDTYYENQILNNNCLLWDSYFLERWSTPLNLSYKGGKAITVFDSREHAVDWITGHRDIYTTDKFNNYQSGNSIRITGDSLNNSNNTYNIINNTVNNYYENGGGYTDADIAAIIAAILAELESSGSGSGNTDITVSGGDLSGGISGGSSGGLSGFLDGIGAVLDAVLAIVGKLLEYVGKAIDLFSDVILKVIDIIPRGFTSFVTELMPFLPKEWLTAIELMLALSVILMIVNFFKK